MSFCFNFNVPGDPAASVDFDEKELQEEKTSGKAEHVSNNSLKLCCMCAVYSGALQP